MQQYLVLQGVVTAALVVGGVPGVFRDMADVSQLDIGFATEKGTHKEHRSGKRLEDFSWGKSTSGTVDMAVDSLHAQNIAMLFQGDVAELSGTLTAEPISVGAGVPAVGSILRIPHGNLSTVVITDSTGSPKTLVANTNYKLDPDYGEIEILNTTTGGPFVGPLKAAAAYGAQTNMRLMTADAPEYWVRYKGLNPDGLKVLVELYRWRPDPGDKLSLITDDVVPAALKGSVLADSTKEADAVLGQFGRVVYL